MRRLRFVRFLTVFLLLGALQASHVQGEDTKGKWQFGFGLSYFSTTDYIRSNSDLAFSTGVPMGNGLPPVTSIDERPDINILNQASIADDFKLDVSASYGLTRWLAVEAAAGYQKSAVGPQESRCSLEVADDQVAGLDFGFAQLRFANRSHRLAQIVEDVEQHGKGVRGEDGQSYFP